MNDEPGSRSPTKSIAFYFRLFERKLVRSELRTSGLKPLISLAPLTYFVTRPTSERGRLRSLRNKKGEQRGKSRERVKLHSMLKYRVFRVLSRVRMIIARPLALESARSLITRIIKDVFSCRRNGHIRKLHASVSRISLFSLPRYLSLRETLSFVLIYRSSGKIHICLLLDPRSLISCSYCIISSETGYHRGKFIRWIFRSFEQSFKSCAIIHK